MIDDAKEEIKFCQIFEMRNNGLFAISLGKWRSEKNTCDAALATAFVNADKMGLYFLLRRSFGLRGKEDVENS